MRSAKSGKEKGGKEGNHGQDERAILFVPPFSAIIFGLPKKELSWFPNQLPEMEFGSFVVGRLIDPV